MNQNPDPMDQPEADPGKRAPRAVLDKLMSDYENLNDRAVAILERTAANTVPNNYLVTMLVQDRETLRYLVSTTTGHYLKTQIANAHSKMRASVEATLDMADMLDAAAAAARAEKDQGK